MFVAPVADVPTAALPFLSLDRTVFLLILLLDPVDGTMSAGFVRFQVGTRNNYTFKQKLTSSNIEGNCPALAAISSAGWFAGRR